MTTTCSQNYKFEGKERDTETGDDDFGARYYTFRLGRWLSADWSSVPAPVPYANLTNPQTLNLYAMVNDNPESFADLTGHGCEITAPGGITCTNVMAINRPNITGEDQNKASQKTGTGTGQSPTQQAQQPTQQAQQKQQLSAVRADDNGDYLSMAIYWKLSTESKTGGRVVQHVIGDWNNNSEHPGHYDYWEAWYIHPGKSETNFHNKVGFDDKFSGGFGTKIHAEASFYEGLKLPSTFKVNGVEPAGGLRSVLNASAPHLPTAHATPPVIRDWNP